MKFNSVQTSKSKHETVLDTVNEVTTIAKNLGIAQLTTENTELDGRMIQVNGKSLINFGSCSYLGLEKNEMIIDGIIDATRKFGSQFSSSRAYLSVTLYKEAEELLEKIFNRPIILTPTVTLGHFASMPVIVGDRDAVVLDLQVHSCVQQAAQLLKNRGVHVELIRHSRMDILEERIKELSANYEKVWYMADGVYSMFGDTVPIEKLYEFLDNYPQFYLYVDDAHGTSWTGKNGAGVMYNHRFLHEKLYLVASLNKSFSASGGVLIFPNKEIRDYVRNCGSTLIFSGPVQPPMLGAVIASAKLHLSPEIYTYQSELKKRIDYFIDTCKNFNLPLIGEFHSPIFFIAVNKPQLGYNMLTRLVNKGFYINLSVFPSVPFKNTGLRIPINANHSFEQIYDLLKTIADQLPTAMLESGVTFSDIYKAFKIEK